VPESFDEFYRREWRSLVRLLMSYGATREEAKDAATETMCRLYRRWDTERPDNPAGWIRRDGIWSVQKEIQKRRRQEEIALHIGFAERVDTLADNPGAYRSAEALLEQEGLEEVRRSLNQLPRAQHEVMALTIAGHPPREIASMTGKSVSAVKANLREARKKLRKCFDEKRHGRRAIATGKGEHHAAEGP
jgi:RNA polymerase sigma factor (sigma-70 family)